MTTQPHEQEGFSTHDTLQVVIFLAATYEDSMIKILWITLIANRMMIPQ